MLFGLGRSSRRLPGQPLYRAIHLLCKVGGQRVGSLPDRKLGPARWKEDSLILTIEASDHEAATTVLELHEGDELAIRGNSGHTLFRAPGANRP